MKRLFIIALLLTSISEGYGQIMFWNLENFFDTVDNPAKNDDEFTPRGERHWSNKRFETKAAKVAQGIISTADTSGCLPYLVGFCEVENRKVLEFLLQRTPLAKAGYSYIHYESPDARGIDVALIYSKKIFKVLNHNILRTDSLFTRDILHVKGVLLESDTLHLFVNHWPSKLSGSTSLGRREIIARMAANAIDSIMQSEMEPKILLMGDFNDTPSCGTIISLCNKCNLINLASPFERQGVGTLKYKGSWEMIDQFLASPAMVGIIQRMIIHRPDFLLEEDRSFMGYKPRRTYIGPRYNGGVSDHLPVVLLLNDNY